jgi:Tol biopolymer transport system component
MRHRPVSALLWLLLCAVLVACGRSESVPDAQATEVAARSLATLNAKALPTATALPTSSALPTQEPTATSIAVAAEPETPVLSVTPASTGNVIEAPSRTPTNTTLASTTPSATPSTAPSTTSTATPTPTPTGTPTPTSSPTSTPTATRTPLPSSKGLAFASNRDGNVELYVMDDEGGNVTRLTHNAAEDARPAWSPDGARIAFESTRDDPSPGMCGSICLYHIYVMNADGSNVARLSGKATNDLFPTWSPDGTRIAFASGRDGNWEIYVMNAGGGGEQRLTNNPAEDFSPAWSPYGGRLAFDSNRDGNYEIYVMNADGSGTENVTQSPGDDISPAWSPDGTRLAFVSNRDGSWEVYVMQANGAGVARLTGDLAEVDRPAWSPDGARIAFSSTRDEPNLASCDPNCNHEIYVVHADGGGLVRLTDNSAHDWDPAWSPR